MIKLKDILKELDVHPDEKQCECTPETVVKELCGPVCKGKRWVKKKVNKGFKAGMQRGFKSNIGHVTLRICQSL